MEFNSFGLMSVLKRGGQSSANASLLLDKGKANASKAELVELVIADMLRSRAAAASSSAEREPIRPKTSGQLPQISDAFIHDLSDATRMSFIDVKNISRWVKSELEDELQNIKVWYRSGSSKAELITLLVNSIALIKHY